MVNLVVNLLVEEEEEEEGDGEDDEDDKNVEGFLVEEGKLSGLGFGFIFMSGMSLLSIGLPVDKNTGVD